MVAINIHFEKNELNSFFNFSINNEIEREREREERVRKDWKDYGFHLNLV